MIDSVSIVIPVRIDSVERKENLRYVLWYLLQSPFVHIDIIEADSEQRFHCPLHNRVRYRFIQDVETVFYRTHFLNQLLINAEYPIVGVWDTDIIVQQKQLVEAIEMIENGNVMSFPYNGEFRLLNKDESTLIRNGSKVLSLSSGVLLMRRPSVGGAFLVNKEKYLLAGGENEGFYGWGPEDIERVKRMEILGHFVGRVKGPCYHLYHPRVAETGVNHGERTMQNQKVLLDTCNKTKEELTSLIKKHIGVFSYMKSWT
ncbi:galactosyltransferase-related protein [uncultured Bacteroides sp.]|uniref:galactosyltransferase-related protein n=1 Tax=uncultured Bacteroides sp. TaxID=162156 RepID=UPI0026771123|nr:galactosyltransferase-related protein [uncultured Bacteroides sp.]